MIKSFSGQYVFSFAIPEPYLLTLAKTDNPSIFYSTMENMSDHKQTFQSDDAKTGKYEIMNMVVNMYLNKQTI